MKLRANEKPGCENLAQTRIYVIRSLANLVNHDSYSTMSFDDCMKFVMNDARGSVNPWCVQNELLMLFKDRGFEVELPIDRKQANSL